MNIAIEIDRDLINARRDALHARYLAGEISVNDYISGDEALEELLWQDTESKMAPILAVWEEARRDKSKVRMLPKRNFSDVRVTKLNY